MTLVLGIFWLLGAVGLFAYEYFTGDHRFRFRMLNISNGWLMLVLAAFNFARYYSARAGAADREAMRIVHEARVRRARTHERPTEPDPTFDFTDKPGGPAAPRNPTDLPPSNN
jgi:hypothetical protein